ncbi:hypothetical protein Nepgr_032814 [Nepenthes gracilis]|uniref:Bifunctional inhibitor/plant lipid transfer protein/seed storage helical domain-containing protein n=1 Tax=Nepenthes gracilis TaxID=150966 RepID=A0AAD3TKT7_NEPGR|nr:hypothetical protein Nepgr_032814 [Nepenthes gracilis]
MEMGKGLVAFLLIFGVILQVSNGETICGVDVDELVTCRPAATRPSPAPPSPQCCKAIAKADLKCLCEFKASPFLPTFGLDPPLVLAIPAKCGLPNPPC